MLSPTVAAIASSTGPSLAVDPVSIPGLVDRPQMVISVGANEVQIDEFNRWASPLRDNLTRIIAIDLVGLLGTADLSTSQASSSADPAYRIAVDVQRIDSVLGQTAALDAIWTVRATHRTASKRGHSIVTEAVVDNSYDALAAAHSRAVGRLSMDIADAIRALESAPRS
jgi:hypothetical protein